MVWAQNSPVIFTLGLTLVKSRRNGLEHLPYLAQRTEHGLALPERVAHDLFGVLDHLVGLAAVYLVGADLAPQLVDHVGDHDGLEKSDAELGVELQGVFTVPRLVEAARLLEQEDPELVEAGVAERLPVLGLVHAEAAWSTRCRR